MVVVVPNKQSINQSILAKASKLSPKSQLPAWRLECEMLHFSQEKLDFYHALSKLVRPNVSQKELVCLQPVLFGFTVSFYCAEIVRIMCGLTYLR